ncbi:MAG: tRNA (adenosine(37)-N6)-threonylcarbamoyltransferase complex dimerization subunit type 1 TsaB, partial [Cyanobacteria bacterium J06649_11]
FTGTRIGVVAARTLGQELNISVFAVSTLAAFAWENRSDNDNFIAVQMPAQRGMLFGAIYQVASDGRGIIAVVPDMVISPEQWQEKLASWNEDYRLLEAKSSLANSVKSMLQLAYFDWEDGKRPNWDEALPFYGQHPVN